MTRAPETPRGGQAFLVCRDGLEKVVGHGFRVLVQRLRVVREQMDREFVVELGIRLIRELSLKERLCLG